MFSDVCNFVNAKRSSKGLVFDTNSILWMVINQKVVYIGDYPSKVLLITYHQIEFLSNL